MAKDKKNPQKTKTKKGVEQNQELFNAAKQTEANWLEYRKFMRRAFGRQPITQQDEQKFLDLKSNLTRLQRVLAQRLPEGFRYGSKNMHDLMAQTISLSGIREVPMADKKGLYVQWHKAHINMQHMLGILDVMAEGHEVKFETVKAKSGNLKEDIGLDTGKKKDNKKKMVTVLLLAGAAAAVYYFFFM